MDKIKKPGFLVGSMVLILLTSFPQTVYACGLIMGYNSETSVWEPVTDLKFDAKITMPGETMQSAKVYIEFNRGNTESWVWLFPVPIANGDISVDLVNSFDYPYNFRTLSSEMSTVFKVLVSLFTGSHAHFISVNDILEIPWFEFYHDNPYLLPVKDRSATTTQKLKLETYTFSADKKEEFFKYIEDNNFTLPGNGKEIIQEYFAKNYSIVFNYFFIKRPSPKADTPTSNDKPMFDERVEELLNKTPGLKPFMDLLEHERLQKEERRRKAETIPLPGNICINAFYTINSIPSKQIFFPQKLLNLYPEEKIPVNIYVDSAVQVMNDENKKTMYYTYSRIENQLINFKLLEIWDVPKIILHPRKYWISLKSRISNLRGRAFYPDINNISSVIGISGIGNRNTAIRKLLKKYPSQITPQVISYIGSFIEPKEIKDDLWLKTDTFTMKKLSYLISLLYTVPGVILLYSHIIFYAIITSIMSYITGMICFKDKTRPWGITLIVLGFLFGIHVLLFCIAFVLLYLWRRLWIPKEIKNIVKKYSFKVRILGFSLYFLTMFLFNAIYSLGVVLFFRLVLYI